MQIISLGQGETLLLPEAGSKAAAVLRDCLDAQALKERAHDSAPFSKAEPAALRRLFDLNFLKAQAGSLVFKGGRGQTVLFTLAGHGLVLRRYLRGGLWGRLMGDKFCVLGPHARRALLEAELLEHMAAAGLPVAPAVLGLQIRQGLFYRQALITQAVPDSRNLAEVMAERSLTPDECGLIGRTLARFFAAGIHHTDLNLRNILLTKSGECVVIDFDKCFALKSLGFNLRMTMLHRLQRSFNKELTKNPLLNYDELTYTLIEQAALQQTGH